MILLILSLLFRLSCVSYFNNRIDTISNTKHKIDEIIRIILIESFINNRFVYDDVELLTKGLVDKLFKNIKYIYDLIDEQLSNYSDPTQLVNKILHVSYESDRDTFINTFLGHEYITIIFTKILEFQPDEYCNISQYIVDKIIDTLLKSKGSISIKANLEIFFAINIIHNNLRTKDNIYNFNSNTTSKNIKARIFDNLNNNIYEVMEVICSKTHMNDYIDYIDFSYILNMIPSLFEHFDNLDEHEIVFKKVICKKLLNKTLFDEISLSRLHSVSCAVNQFNIKTPLKIINSVKESLVESKEYNFANNLAEDFTNVSVFPVGITP